MRRIENSKILLGLANVMVSRIVRKIITCDDISEKKILDDSIFVILDLLPEQKYFRKQPFYLDKKHLDPSFDAALTEILAQSSSGVQKISLFNLPNGILFGQGTVVTANGALVKDSAAEFLNHNIPPDGSTYFESLLEITNFDKMTSIKGVSILVKRPWYRNYGHWLVDLMPILPLLHNKSIKVDNIIFGDIPEGNIKIMMQLTSQHLFPDANIIFAPDTDVIECENLYYVRPVHVPPLFKHPGAVAETVGLAKRLFPSASVGDPEKIYISRNRTNSRRVSNETELCALLSRYNFTTIYPEDLDIAQQISIFEHAQIILGVKGAGLTNSIFCNEGSHVIALSPSKFVDPFFWDVVSQRGIAYSEIYCEDYVSVNPSDLSNTDIYVDLSSINSLLSQI